MTAAGAAVRDEKHTFAAVLAAAAIGYAERQGTQLPHLQQIGVPATYGLAAFAVARFTKNKIARHVSTGLLSVAAYNWAKTPGGRTSGDEIEF